MDEYVCVFVGVGVRGAVDCSAPAGGERENPIKKKTPTMVVKVF